MAGRKILLMLPTATLAVAALAASPAGAVAAPKTGPIVVSQLDTNVSMGLGRVEPGWNKKIAQIFVPPAEAHKLARVSLMLAGEDETVVVKVYEVGKKPPFGTLLRKTNVVADQQWGQPGGTEWQRAAIRPALRMDPDKRYSIVLKVADRKAYMAAAGGSDYERGRTWCYCWESADFEELAWRPDEWGTDLTFRLRFWRRG
jgi:hypothetical protein